MVSTADMRKFTERVSRSGPTRSNALYPSADVCVTELKATLNALSVSKRRMARMLNLPILNDIHGWFSGRRRPGTFYMLRISHLMRLAAQGNLDIINFDGRTYWASVGMGAEHEHGRADNAWS